MIKEIYEKMIKKYGESEGVFFRIRTGSIFLDDILDGGYPSGRMTEIYGQEGSGKTTLGIQAMAEAQSQGLLTALIDAEYSFDLNYAHAIGLHGKPNVDFVHMMPEYGEQAVEMVRDLINDGVKLIVVDSIAAMTPKAELLGDTGESFMGLQARMMGQGCRQLTGPLFRANTALIWTNQVRSKIGQFFGSPEVTSGGRAMKFFASLRLQVRSTEANESGHKIIVKVVKSKVSPPLRTASLPLVYGLGVDIYQELFQVLFEAGEITAKGTSWYFFNGEKFNGQEKIAAYLREKYAKNKIAPLLEKIRNPSHKSTSKRS